MLAAAARTIGRREPSSVKTEAPVYAPVETREDASETKETWSSALRPRVTVYEESLLRKQWTIDYPAAATANDMASFPSRKTV